MLAAAFDIGYMYKKKPDRLFVCFLSICARITRKPMVNGRALDRAHIFHNGKANVTEVCCK